MRFQTRIEALRQIKETSQSQEMDWLRAKKRRLGARAIITAVALFLCAKLESKVTTVYTMTNKYPADPNTENNRWKSERRTCFPEGS